MTTVGTDLAFPCPAYELPGLTKRELFAGLILAGFSSPQNGNPGTRDILAGEAVRQADALVDALNILKPKE
jgi:hypothetical protein